MFITKKQLPRRTFLKGAGVTLALPLLESMLPAMTPTRQQSAANPPTRFLGIFSPHGWAREADNTGYWIPSTVGSDFEMPFTLTPLTPFRDQMVVFSGWDSTSSMPPPGSSGGDHSRASASLTGVNPRKTPGGADLYGGTSIDQIIAQQTGQDTLLPSVQLAIEDPGSNTGICGWGYSCAYSNSISWAAPDRPLPAEINPQVVFERLFGSGGTVEERVTRRSEDRSILDSISRKVRVLQQDLPASDQNRLSAYLDEVREIERRLEIAAKVSADQPSIDVPFGVPESFDEHIQLMYDLLAVAWQADITRVGSLMYARDVSLRAYPASGITTVNHSCSHHREDPDRRREYGIMNRYHLQSLAYFLNRLRETPDGDGNLLDHSLTLWTSNMGNGNQHNHNNVGHLWLGGASGKAPGNLHLKGEGPTSNILLSTLHMFGVDNDSIGDSTGVAV